MESTQSDQAFSVDSRFARDQLTYEVNVDAESESPAMTAAPIPVRAGAIFVVRNINEITNSVIIVKTAEVVTVINIRRTFCGQNFQGVISDMCYFRLYYCIYVSVLSIALCRNIVAEVWYSLACMIIRVA